MPLILLSRIFIYVALVMSLAAALGVVLLPNLFHSALCLVATLIGVAILYLALQAEFIAIVQILLYVGAVATLIIFVIMLTHRLGDKAIPQTNRQSLPAALALTAFVGLVTSLLFKMNWPAAGSSVSRVDTLALGRALLGAYVFPFEVVSVVLIAALIGAVVIARQNEGGSVLGRTRKD